MATPTQATIPSVEDHPDWSTLTGLTLEGGYELKEILEAEIDRAMLRVRVLGDYSLRASATFYVMAVSRAQEQVSIWETVRGLDRSVSVRRPLGTGVLHLNGRTVSYVIWPVAEETLADVLTVRALSGGEAREFVQTVARGLTELHAAGLVHGSVSPVEVLAMGDSIVLSAESVRPINGRPLLPMPAKYIAPESDGQNITAAADVWCLGATLVEALTQREYERTDLDATDKLDHPFSSAAASCLEPDPDLRCKTGDLPKLLQAEKPSRAASKPVPIAKVEPKQIAPEPTVAGLPAIAPSPVPVLLTQERLDQGAKAPEAPKAKLPNELPARGIRLEPVTNSRLPNELPSPLPNELGRAKSIETAGPGQARVWMYVIVAGIVISLLFLLLRQRPKAASSALPSSPTSQTAPSTNTAWPTKTLGPPAASPKKASIAAQPPPVLKATVPRTGTANPANWRVVLFTFNRQQDAENKAKSLNGRHPELAAQTFSPSGGTPYLVVSGGPVTRDQAAQRKMQALRYGMPRDSYIQNFTK